MAQAAAFAARMGDMAQDIGKQQRVLIDQKASVTHTVIEVNAHDEPGVLHRMTLALARVGVQIHSATISTYGERFVDVFYVKDVFGLKIANENKLGQIRAALLAVMSEDGSATRPAAARPPAARTKKAAAPASPSGNATAAE